MKEISQFHLVSEKRGRETYLKHVTQSSRLPSVPKDARGTVVAEAIAMYHLIVEDEDEGEGSVRGVETAVGEAVVVEEMEVMEEVNEEVDGIVGETAIEVVGEAVVEVEETSTTLGCPGTTQSRFAARLAIFFSARPARRIIVYAFLCSSARSSCSAEDTADAVTPATPAGTESAKMVSSTASRMVDGERTSRSSVSVAKRRMGVAEGRAKGR